MADVSWQIDDTQMRRVMDELERESVLADYEIVTTNARTLLRSVVFNTPKQTGRGRAGWWPAWRALEMAGTPGTRFKDEPHRFPPGRSAGVGQRDKRLYKPRGTVDDRRNETGKASFAFENETVVVSKEGTELEYLRVTNVNQHWMQDAIDETRDSEGWEGTDPTWWPTRADVREALRASESKWIDPRGGWAGIADYPKYEKVVTSLMNYFSKQKREV